MLLRSITKHVRDQNWLAVALDFFIVVAGILIAFQITNWNEARTDAIQEKEILADLLDDLRADQAALSSSLQLTTLGIDAGNTALLTAGLKPVQSVSFPGQTSALVPTGIDIELPSRPTDEMRSNLWKHVTLRLYPAHNDATIESLIAAGKSSIIQNTSLVRDLQRYRTLWTGVESAQVNTFRPIRDRAIFVGQEHDLSPHTPVDPDVLAEALRNDPTLRAALRTMVEYTIAHQGFFERLQQDAETLAMRIEEDLQQ